MSMKRGSRTRKPKARTAELLVEELGEEVLVYDQRGDQVHCLSSAAQQVWCACDGETSVEQLGSRLKLDSELVARALGELDACGLLDDEATSGLTRREATARFASVGAAAAAAPLIYSIAAPAPAQAQTLLTCLALNKPCSKGTAVGVCFNAGCATCNATGTTGGGSAPPCRVCVADCNECSSTVFLNPVLNCASPCKDTGLNTPTVECLQNTG